MENSDDAPRLLVQDGRFVKIFCAVLRATVKTILPLKHPIRPHLVQQSCILGVRNLSQEYTDSTVCPTGNDE